MMAKIAAVLREHPLRVVVLFTIASSLLRVWLAHHYFGFQTGDDVEVAEEAFRRAVGLVHSPWNIRSLLIPDLFVAPVVYVSHALGVGSARALAEIARYPFILFSAVNILLVFALGRRWYGDTAGVIASALYAFHWMPLVYGSSLFPRTIAVTCILSASILLSGGGNWRRALLAGMLAAFAMTARYSEAIYFGSLLLLAGGLERTARRRTIPPLLAGFLAGAVIFIGLYDRLTWGRWFGSLIEFANLIFVRGDAASSAVVQPPWWYLSNVLYWIPLTLLPGLIVAARSTELRRTVAFVVFPLFALSAIFHKEVRYFQVIVPFVLLIATRGCLIWWNQANRRRLTAVLLAAAVPFGLTHIGLIARRSTNAATAALSITSRRPSGVALSQAWAYGGRLFLGNEPMVLEVGVPPNPAQIRRAAPALSALAVYSDDADDALRRTCLEAGLSRQTTFSDQGGRSVNVYWRP
jgi:hypothetical protein